MAVGELTFLELEANLWDMAADALCVTTNGDINKQGEAVMGRGVALQATKIHLGVPLVLAKKIRGNGNVTQILDFPNGHSRFRRDYWLVSLPVKHHWNEKADIGLIATSLTQLVELANRMFWGVVALPRPGCGNGKLSWEREVREVCEAILDERFVIVHRQG